MILMDPYMKCTTSVSGKLRTLSPGVYLISGYANKYGTTELDSSGKVSTKTSKLIFIVDQ